eukprot:CAMPEP_0204631048 /NCGR_PEP_ID=MMETSP0717-20131115/21909_1 /ASSEMBLY_ACC=CAM_ASM_000666 /TAXON_ID=230516 /ORGANISM="Chaetoceros curvisetus" /LENGTH=67 /DNA_ID=CAMNT_0051648513 /DNA_START=60 /DNA_END=260 /DNA_ORIENTATION=-
MYGPAPSTLLQSHLWIYFNMKPDITIHEVLTTETTGIWTIITNLGSTIICSSYIFVIQGDPGAVLGD